MALKGRGDTSDRRSGIARKSEKKDIPSPKKNGKQSLQTFSAYLVGTVGGPGANMGFEKASG